jgi:hypothetical protein
MRVGGATKVVDSWQVRHLGVTRDVDTFWIGTSGGQKSVSFGYNVLTITGTEKALDLAAYIPGDGFPFRLQVNVTLGALVYSDEPVPAAIYSSTAFPANSFISFVIDGKVHGCNGAGGRGASYTNVVAGAGLMGGRAITTPCNAEVNFGTSGELFGGGGGGGGGGVGYWDAGIGYIGGGGGGGYTGGAAGIGSPFPAPPYQYNGTAGVTAKFGPAAGGAGGFPDALHYGGTGGACGVPGTVGATGGGGLDFPTIWPGSAGGGVGYSVDRDVWTFDYNEADVGSHIKGDIVV